MGALSMAKRCACQIGLRRLSLFAGRSSAIVALLISPVLAVAAGDVLLKNPFHDPFLQVTHGMPNCPVPQEPTYTEEEYNNLAHDRAQRGVSCWLAGQCRLSNAYLYDAEIGPRVGIAVNQRNQYPDTSVWALIQRRRVRLKGCVQTAEQAKEIEAVVRNIDDVEGVDNQLMVGTQGKPSYDTSSPSGATRRP